MFKLAACPNDALESKTIQFRITCCIQFSCLFSLPHSGAILSFSLSDTNIFQSTDKFFCKMTHNLGLSYFILMIRLRLCTLGRKTTEVILCCCKAFKELIILFLKPLENDYQCNPIFNLREKQLRKKIYPNISLNSSVFLSFSLFFF